MNNEEILHGAAVLLLNKNGSILMQHRDDKPGVSYPDHWCYPAGTAEKGEDFKDAAIRELTEETAYIPDRVHFLLEGDYTRSNGKMGRRHIYWALYDNIQKIECYEGQEMKFLHMSNLAEKKLLPGQLEIITMALEQLKK